MRLTLVLALVAHASALAVTARPTRAAGPAARRLGSPTRAAGPAVRRLGSPVCATSVSVTPHRADSPPHIALASSLVELLVGLFTRLATGSLSRPGARTAAHRQRETEPCFIGSALCSRVHDIEAGNTFYLCENPVDEPGYSSRKCGRDGRWVYYTTHHGAAAL